MAVKLRKREQQQSRKELDMADRQEKQFAGLLIAIVIVVFMALGAMNSPLGLTILAGLVVMIAIIAILFPSILSRSLNYWMKFGKLVGAITSPLALAAIFCLLFLPLGLFKHHILRT